MLILNKLDKEQQVGFSNLRIFAMLIRLLLVGASVMRFSNLRIFAMLIPNITLGITDEGFSNLRIFAMLIQIIICS